MGTSNLLDKLYVSDVKRSEFTPFLKVWGSIASTLRQQAKPLGCMATLVYSMPAL